MGAENMGEIALSCVQALIDETTHEIGVDVVDIASFSADLGADGVVLRAMFTQEELDECTGNRERLAARFAAKEAALKVLGMGILDMRLTDILVHTALSGKPSIRLQGDAVHEAERRGLSEFACSMTHEGGLALAVVVAKRS